MTQASESTTNILVDVIKADFVNDTIKVLPLGAYRIGGGLYAMVPVRDSQHFDLLCALLEQYPIVDDTGTAVTEGAPTT